MSKVYIFDAWVHPATGGDDYNVGIKVKGATSLREAKKEVTKALKKEGSAILDDYVLVK